MPSDAPALDAKELRFAAQEVAALLRQVEPGSVVASVLTQTLRELKSLRESADQGVIAQYRTRAA